MDQLSMPGALATALTKLRHLVVFTGAGVSAESGIPTFRDALTGLWSRFNAEDLATSDAFLRNPELVWGWYEGRRYQVEHSMPNPAHRAIAELAHYVPRLTLITQNVDNLHERAGSHSVLHLHGSLHHPRCMRCAHPAILPKALELSPGAYGVSPPKCVLCGGLVRPGVVWFGEMLPEHTLATAFEAAADCDVLVSVGTSGVVYPAAHIPLQAQQAGAWVVHINPQPISVTKDRVWAWQGAAGVLMPQFLARVAANSST